jgi:uncharacterized protein
MTAIAPRRTFMERPSVPGPVLILAGLWDSGPMHWQSLWARRYPTFVRVRQRDWSTPRAQDWIETLDLAVERAGPEALLVAHSLACALVGHWARASRRRVRGALLVAPSDLEAPSYPAGSSGFAPMPLARLPFRSTVVASEDDPYVSLERARAFAGAWGSTLVNAGRLGHVNSASALGMWPRGMALLSALAG